MHVGAEVIKRFDGALPIKEQISGKLQVSYNDWGHLVLRFIDSNGSDCLIVLSKAATEQVVSFIKKYLNVDQIVDTIPF